MNKSLINGIKIPLGTLHVLLDNDCSIRVYQSFAAIFQKYFLLCLMLSVIYYAQNYAGIIGCSLAVWYSIATVYHGGEYSYSIIAA